MAYLSVLATQLERLVSLKGWSCVEANRFTIRVTEPSLDETTHLWMAGEAHSIDPGEVIQVRPTRLIVPDDTSDNQVARLAKAMEDAGRPPKVVLWTNFLDQLWDASRAAQRARLDAFVADELSGGFPQEGTPAERHVTQNITLGALSLRDAELLDKAFSIEGHGLAILADAGLGKSELLQWLEWRYAVLYESAVAQRARMLPPVAIRVPLLGLRSMSMDSIANFLAQPDIVNKLPALRGIESGAFLIELLRMKRIVLLLDGVDELIITRDGLESEIRELRRITANGGRVAVAARIGHFRSVGLITRVFKESEIAKIGPMSSDSGELLLMNHGASANQAREVVRAMSPSEAAGIPLFLLLALRAGVKEGFNRETLASKTSLLLELVRLFCVRDERRLDIDEEEQQRYLTDLAMWMSIDRSIDVEGGLERLGLDPSEPAASILNNPHALLIEGDSGFFEFLYPQFYALFLSRALSLEWRDGGLRSVRGHLEANKLDDYMCEYLAHMVPIEVLCNAWGEASPGNSRSTAPLLRRNLLAIALAQVDEQGNGGSPAVRSALLREILGAPEISDVSLAEVKISMFDFSGWSLARLSGAGGSMTFCQGFRDCDFDQSIWTIGTIEGCDFSEQADFDLILRVGWERLQAMLGPLKQRNTVALVGMVTIAECQDKKGWRELSKWGFVNRQRRGGGGVPFWLFIDGTATSLGKIIAMAHGDVTREGVTNIHRKAYPLLLRLGGWRGDENELPD